MDGQFSLVLKYCMYRTVRYSTDGNRVSTGSNAHLLETVEVAMVVILALQQYGTSCCDHLCIKTTVVQLQLFRRVMADLHVAD